MDNLFAAAKAAYESSYSPYSDFRVGAALLCVDGTVYTGCNVENACGTSICAERTAVVKAVSEGKRKFEAIAIACDKQEECYPCGICRQFLYEFAPDLVVYVAPDKSYKLSDLLPHGFGAELL